MFYRTLVDLMLAKHAESTKSATAVTPINLVRFIGVNTSPEATVVMKLDIEGAEFTVFPQLVLSGVLCKYIDFAFVEWHDLNRGFQNTPILGGLKPGHKQAVSQGLEATAAAEKEPRAGTEDWDAIYQRGIRRKGEGDFVLRRRQG